MTQRQVVVVGAGQGGLSAAVHLRLQGHDVLVLEKSDRVGGKARRIQEGGYTLDPGPSIIILKELYEGVFRAAGRNPADYLRFRRLDPFTRVITKETGPLDLPSDREACQRLVQQVAPNDAQAFATLMGKLDKVAPHIDRSIFDHPYHHPWQLMDPHLVATALQFDVRATYKDLADGWFQSPLLRAFFYGFPSYGGQTYDSKAPGALLIPYYMIQGGVYVPEGGVAAIPESFERLARELGVEFETEAEVVGGEEVNGRLKNVRLANGGTLEADAFVFNQDRLTARAMLGRPVDWSPSLSYFTLHWGIRRPPEGLLHHTLLIPDGFEHGFDELYRQQRFPQRPIVYLNATNVIDPEVAPPGCTNLFAVITSPAKQPHIDWRQESESFRNRVTAILHEFDLGFRESDLDFERMQNPDLFQARDGSYRGSLYGPEEKHRVMGLFPQRIVDEDVRNVFYAGGSVQPGAGLPMVTLSGRFAAQLVTRMKG